MLTAQSRRACARASNIARLLTIALTLLAFVAPSLEAQSQRQPVTAGKRYQRLAIRNAMIVDGNGTPASGPKDIIIEGNKIAQVVPIDPVAVKEGRFRRQAADAEIDATGKYVLPGLINAHGHVQDERGGVPMPVDYCLKLWLASGITTVRDVGSNTQKTLALREKSQRGEVAAPRLFVYPSFAFQPAPRTVDEARARVSDLKKMGVDGI
jgi:imidazolonepropionase-like amidohydrolase